MKHQELLAWLLESDIAIQYQVHRDLLSEDRPDLQKRISGEGFAAELPAKRKADGNWGRGFYQPKWSCTHYTLLDFRHLCVAPENPLIQESIRMTLDNERAVDGGIGPFGAQRLSDQCVNGMFLNYAAYFQTDEQKLRPIVDCILNLIMADGGFNCRCNRVKCVHSSLHTTISVLEGFTEFIQRGYSYRAADIKRAIASSIEFVLQHQLYISDRTGEIIKQGFLKLCYPCRWRYDILRALDYFQHAGIPWDERMQPAIEQLLKKQNGDTTWNVPAHHPGEVHFHMEKSGRPSRWNTLRALRVLKHFGV